MRRIFRPWDENEIIGAKVEHEGQNGREPQLPAASLDRSRRYSSAGGLGFLLSSRKLSPPSRKISEFSASRSAMAVAIVVLKRMFPRTAVLLLSLTAEEKLHCGRGSGTAQTTPSLLEYLQRHDWIARPAAIPQEFVELCPLHRES